MVEPGEKRRPPRGLRRARSKAEGGGTPGGGGGVFPAGAGRVTAGPRVAFELPSRCTGTGRLGDATPELAHVLHLAAGFGHAEAVRALLDAGARADVVDSPAGRTPRALAEAMGHAEVVSVFDAAAAAT